VEHGAPKLLLEQLDDSLLELFELSMQVRAKAPVTAAVEVAAKEASTIAGAGSPAAIEACAEEAPAAADNVQGAVAAENVGELNDDESPPEDAEHVNKLPPLAGVATIMSEKEIQHLIDTLKPRSVFFDALNAVLNLSCTRDGQPALARHGLWRLLQLRFSVDTLTTGRPDCHFQKIGATVGTILTNVSTHTANLSVMYRAELRVKAALLEGDVSSSRRELKLSASAPEFRARHARFHGEESASGVREPSLPAKVRYVSWLSEMKASEPSSRLLLPIGDRATKQQTRAKPMKSNIPQLPMLERPRGNNLSPPQPATRRLPRSGVGRGAKALLSELAAPPLPRVTGASAVETKEPNAHGSSPHPPQQQGSSPLSPKRSKSPLRSPKRHRSSPPRSPRRRGSPPRAVSPTRCGSPTPRPGDIGALPRKAHAINLDSLMRCSRADTWKLPLQLQLDQVKMRQRNRRVPPPGAEQLPQVASAAALSSIPSAVDGSGSVATAYPTTPRSPGRSPRSIAMGMAALMEMPTPEDGSTIPDTLETLGLDQLPSRPQPPRLLSCDTPRPFSLRDISLFWEGRAIVQPPVNDGVHFQLDEKEKDVLAIYSDAYNDIHPLELKVFDASLGNSGIDAVKGAPFNMLNSIFTPRIYCSDATSLFVTEAVTLRAFQIDWGRCNNRDFQEQLNLYNTADVFPDGRGGSADIIQRVEHVLRRNRLLLYSIFSFYSSTDGMLHRMTPRGFFTMVSKCNIIDEQTLTANVCATLFQSATSTEYEDEDQLTIGTRRRSSSIDASRLLDAKEEVMLTRFEFFRVLTFIAKLKYSREGTRKEIDVAEALNELIDENLMKVGPPASRVDPNVFRRKRLYTPDCHSVLEMHINLLSKCFQAYCSAECVDAVLSEVETEALLQKIERTLKGLGRPHVDRQTKAMAAQRPAMELNDWLDFLTDCGLLENSNRSPIGHEILFEEATWIFLWSQDFVSDEISRSEHLQHLSFVGFIEAVVRLVCFVQLPARPELAFFNCNTIEELYARVYREHEVEKAALCGSVKPDWRVEDSSNASIKEQLEILLGFIGCRYGKDMTLESLRQLRTELKEQRDRQSQAAGRRSSFTRRSSLVYSL